MEKIAIRIKPKHQTSKTSKTSKTTFSIKTKPKPVLKPKTMLAIAKTKKQISTATDSSSGSELPKSYFPLCDLRTEKGLISAVNLNKQITDMLVKLVSHTRNLRAAETDSKKRSRHSHRINSFEKAMGVIKSHSKPITSGKEAMALPGVGKGIGNRIDEILSTGTLREIEDTIDDKTRCLMELTQVTGIGEQRAKTLYDLGVSGIDDLVSKYHSGIIKVARNQLTHHIAIGLEFYHDLSVRIPWDEVDMIRDYLEEQIFDMVPELEVKVCGSYRRKKETCGDIDVLVTHPDLKTEADIEVCERNYLPDIIETLTENGFLVGNLTDKGKTKYMGVCKLDHDAPGRRIDIRFVPRDSYAAAVLYFTGSGQFNKLMRYKANERGFTINEYGIYYYINGVKGDRIEGIHNEEDIFKVINCKYLEPTEREF